MIQGWQLVIVLAIILLLFGGAKLPKLARSLGEAQKEFRDGLRESEKAETTDAAPSANASAATPPPTAEAPKPAAAGDDEPRPQS